MEFEERIPDTLVWHLSLLSVTANAPLVATITKALPGMMSIETPADKKYFEAFYLPANPENPYLDRGEPAWLQGIFQVSVYWPIGEGIIKVTELARQVKYHFRNKDLDRTGDGKCVVRIVREPWLGPYISSVDRIQIPVTILWDVYSS